MVEESLLIGRGAGGTGTGEGCQSGERKGKGMPDEWHREQEQIPLSSRAARCGGFFGDTGPEDQGRKPSPSLISLLFGGIHTWTMTLHWVSSYLFPKQVW